MEFTAFAACMQLAFIHAVSVEVHGRCDRYHSEERDQTAILVWIDICHQAIPTFSKKLIHDKIWTGVPLVKSNWDLGHRFHEINRCKVSKANFPPTANCIILAILTFFTSLFYQLMWWLIFCIQQWFVVGGTHTTKANY